jgi:hypothetical protein
MDRFATYNYTGKFMHILVHHGLRKEIMFKLDTTYPTVKKALEFKTHTPLAQRIRHYALNNGGVLVEKSRRW